MGFETQEWDLSLGAGISDSRQEFEPRGWDLSLKGLESRLVFDSPIDK